LINMQRSKKNSFGCFVIFMTSLWVFQAASAQTRPDAYKKAVLALFKKSAAEIVTYLGQPEETSQFDQGNEIYYEYFTKGVSLYFKNNRLYTIFFHNNIIGGYETGAYKMFKGNLPGPFSFNLTYPEIKKIFGNPLREKVITDAPFPFRKIEYQKKGFGFNVAKDSGRIIYIYFTRTYK